MRLRDQYAYSGELWLAERIPFAAVKETLRGKDAPGAAYRFEKKLVET